MSGAGAPTVSVDGSGLRVTVVAASWHTEVMDGLLAGARRALAAANVSHVSVVRVPGSFELPVAAARAMICHSVRRGHLNLSHRIDVMNEQGACVLTLPFREAITISG